MRGKRYVKGQDESVSFWPIQHFHEKMDELLPVGAYEQIVLLNMQRSTHTHTHTLCIC